MNVERAVFLKGVATQDVTDITGIFVTLDHNSMKWDKFLEKMKQKITITMAV